MTETRIEGTPTGALDVKRFYMRDVYLVARCPKCDYETKHDFASDYLAYPEVNRPFDHGCYCPKCDHEWTVRLTLSLALAVTS